MKKFVALLLALAMTLSMTAAMAETPNGGFEEFPIYLDGTAENPVEETDVTVTEGSSLHVAAVYFQPVQMEPADKAGLAVEDANIHLEADIHWNENGFGFGVGDWVPYLTVEYQIKSETTGEIVVDWDAFMVMSADDGAHYGANIKLDTADTYTLSFRIHNPSENGYLLHVDEETGVPEHEFWQEPIVVEFVHWNYAVQEW